MGKSLTTSEFVECAIKVHGNTYDYSKTIYEHNKIKVIITCKEHGDFLQTPNCHVSQRQGCPACNMGGKYNTKSFVLKSKMVHGDVYDYSKCDYMGSNVLVNIICPKHGDFSQTPQLHLQGKGCLKCGREKRRISHKEFIERSIQVHGDVYDYSLTTYVKMKEKVLINCKKHGIFSQRPMAHLNGSGCPKCKISFGERQIMKWLNEKNIQYIHQIRFDSCRDKYPLPFDFLIHSTILVEYDGPQHFGVKTKVGRGHIITSEEQKLIHHHDQIKTNWAKNNGYKLIRIPYTKTGNIKKILEGKVIY